VRRWTTTCERETRELGQQLGSEAAPDGLILLFGELGSGKTVLAQGIAQSLGIDVREVQSPSFTLIREHVGGSEPFVHIDLYRLEESAVESIGLEEILVGPGVKAIEWAERLPFPVEANLCVAVRRGDGENMREIEERDCSAE